MRSINLNIRHWRIILDLLHKERVQFERYNKGHTPSPGSAHAQVCHAILTLEDHLETLKAAEEAKRAAA